MLWACWDLVSLYHSPGKGTPGTRLGGLVSHPASWGFPWKQAAGLPSQPAARSPWPTTVLGEAAKSKPQDPVLNFAFCGVKSPLPLVYKLQVLNLGQPATHSKSKPLMLQQARVRKGDEVRMIQPDPAGRTRWGLWCWIRQSWLTWCLSQPPPPCFHHH